MIFQLLMATGLSALVLSVPTLRQNIPQIVSHCTQPKTAALTFDDGPYNNAKYIVDTLDNAGAKGTFFYNGNNWDCIYSQTNNIKYVYEHGHQIGSHTWSHSRLLSLNRKQVISEFQKVDDALWRILGVLPAFWRPPYGEYNQTILDIASGQFERTAVLWDLDSGDSTGSTVAQSKVIYDKAVQSNKPNYISLQHETYSTTARLDTNSSRSLNVWEVWTLTGKYLNRKNLTLIGTAKYTGIGISNTALDDLIDCGPPIQFSTIF